MRQNEAFLENPFRVDGLEMRHYMQKEGEQLMVDPETSELLSVRRVPRNKEQLHDTKVYTKLFTDNIDTFMTLPGAGMKLLLYGMCKVRPLQDSIFLNVDDCLLVCGFKSVTSYREGVKALIDARILARKVGSYMEYWVNPNVFFNGNRLRLV
jgi:hypothetical protein